MNKRIITSFLTFLAIIGTGAISQASQPAVGIFDKDISVVRYWENINNNFIEKWLVVNSKNSENTILALDALPGTLSAKKNLEEYLATNQSDHPKVVVKPTILAANDITIIEQINRIGDWINIYKDNSAIGFFYTSHKYDYIKPNSSKFIITENLNNQYGGGIRDGFWTELQKIVFKPGEEVELKIGIHLYPEKKYYKVHQNKLRYLVFDKRGSINNFSINANSLKHEYFSSYERVHIPWKNDKENTFKDDIVYITLTFTAPQSNKLTVHTISYDMIFSDPLENKGSWVSSNIPIVVDPNL